LAAVRCSSWYGQKSDTSGKEYVGNQELLSSYFRLAIFRLAKILKAF
jgi:hypothetical protein